VSVRSASPERRAAKRGPGRPPGGGVLVDRSQLLEAAIELIRAEGPDVTMADIAASATVTKPILYRTVGDKAALTNALSEVLIERVNTTVEDERHVGMSGRADFVRAVRSYLKVIDVERNLFLFVNGGGQDTDVVRRLVEQSASPLIDLFSQAREPLGLDESGARTWAYAIVGSFQMVALMWIREGYGDIDAVADELTALLWPGVSAGRD
jgi:AcrR family transcriptional regulator